MTRAGNGPTRATSDTRGAARGASHRRLRWTRPRILAGVVVVAVAAGLGGGALLASLRPAAPAPSSSPASGDPFAQRTLDPEAPAFPVPPGATLENAVVEGAGPAAYRLASWTTTATLAETLSFYARVRDPRWTLDGQPVEGIGATSFRFSDGRRIYARAAVDVGATSPVRIAVRFVPPGALPVPSAALPSPSAIAVETLPPASAPPLNLPAWAIPVGGRFVDGGVLGGTALAIYDVASDLASVERKYLEALRTAGFSPTVETAAAGVVLITVGHADDRIALEPAANGIRVSIAATP